MHTYIHIYTQIHIYTYTPHTIDIDFADDFIDLSLDLNFNFDIDLDFIDLNFHEEDDGV